MNQFNDNRINNMERFIKNLQMFLNAKYRFDDAYNMAIQIEQSKNNKKRTIEEIFFDEIFNSSFFDDDDDYKSGPTNYKSGPTNYKSGPTIEFSIDENGRTHWK